MPRYARGGSEYCVNSRTTAVNARDGFTPIPEGEGCRLCGVSPITATIIRRAETSSNLVSFFHSMRIHADSSSLISSISLSATRFVFPWAINGTAICINQILFNWITVAFLSSILSRSEILSTRLLAISSNALFDAISIKREIKATPTRHYHVTIPCLLLASPPFRPPVPFSSPHTRSKRASFSPRISVRFVLRASGI